MPVTSCAKPNEHIKHAGRIVKIELNFILFLPFAALRRRIYLSLIVNNHRQSVPESLGLQSETEILRRLATRIKGFRATAGWTQAQLAGRAGLNRAYLAEIECARRNPSLRSVIKIANALRVPVRELL
jgi:DNA-binding XRE family transcriptional regulator